MRQPWSPRRACDDRAARRPADRRGRGRPHPDVRRELHLLPIHDERPLTKHVHVAFQAREDATVQAFHAAALAPGYPDNGGPGERVVYHPGYYAAFLFDLDGNKIEAVCFVRPD